MTFTYVNIHTRSNTNDWQTECIRWLCLWKVRCDFRTFGHPFHTEIVFGICIGGVVRTMRSEYAQWPYVGEFSIFQKAEVYNLFKFFATCLLHVCRCTGSGMRICERKCASVSAPEFLNEGVSARTCSRTRLGRPVLKNLIKIPTP